MSTSTPFSFVEWPILLHQLKSPDGTERFTALSKLQCQLPFPPASLDVTIQQPLVNVLVHLLHERPSSDASSETLVLPSAPIALRCVHHIFTHPTILTNDRFQVLRKKLSELLQHSQELKSLFVAFPDLAKTIQTSIAEVTSITTDDTASIPSASMDAAATDRREKRLAKEARKRTEAAERRNVKAGNAAVDGGSSNAQSSLPSDTTVAAAIPSDHGVDDGTESAPFGNFHTYYQFNAPSERLQYVPPQMGEFILQRKLTRALSASSTVVSVASDSTLHSSAAAAATNSFSFLDVGCNEGDMTIALLEHLRAGFRGEKNEPKVTLLPSEESTIMTNESGVATSISNSSSSTSPSCIYSPATPSSHPHAATVIHAVGVDIDPLLIERAQGKIAGALERITKWPEDSSRRNSATSIPIPTLQFDTIDMMEHGAIQRIEKLISSVSLPPDPSVSIVPSYSTNPSSRVLFPFDLVCCYSITMWIHLNHGDAGLQRFLSCLASLTTNLLIEPQPWQCYKNARERWRRSGKSDPPHMINLKWRNVVEDEIIKFVTQQCHMHLRADLGSTKWNRKVLWFERR